MADETEAAGAGTPQRIALRLTEYIALGEGYALGGGMGKKPTREWYLRTYAQCLRIVTAPSTITDRLADYSG